MHAQSVEVLVKGIRSIKGSIVIGVFENEKDFKDDNAYITRVYTKTMVSNKNMSVVFPLEPGEYGLAILDDENDNRKMDFNFFGIPKEGFGFSDYYSRGILRPKFDKFKFKLEKDQKKKILVKLRYMN